MTTEHPAPSTTSDAPGHGAALDAEPAGEWLDIGSSAAAAGGRCAVELELYHRTGRLAQTSSSAGARRFLAAASLAHAWRADLWERLLPVSVGLPTREELVVVADRDADLLGSLDPGPGGTSPVGPAGLPASLLVSVYPALLAGYEYLAESANRISDGPLALAATRSAGDVRRVLAEGLALRLTAVGTSASPVEAAADAGVQPAGVRTTRSEGVAVPSLTDGIPGQPGDQTP